MISNTEEARSVTILGATGSIGQNTIKVLQESPDAYRVVALTAKSNVELLAKQAIELQASHAVIADASLFDALKSALSGSKVEAYAGEEALVEIASVKVDWVMSAIVGADGLAPTFAALQENTTVALANKECLVCAGAVLLDKAKKISARVIPVDSEHNAIYQVFNFDQPKEVARIILTASGGPFRNYKAEQMQNVTLKDALNHPNWKMGNKITIDSATMVNKALEVIEAYHLFPITVEQIDVVVHPESIVHSFVEYIDGAILAEMGAPDMCVPIAYALGWPKRIPLRHTGFDFTQKHSLHFEPVDYKQFPAVKMAKEVLQQGQEASIIFNGANEVAVSAFLEQKIEFTEIIPIIEQALNHITLDSLSSIDDVLQAIPYVRAEVESYVATGHF